MGLIDKVAFWKKKDDFGGMDKDLGKDPFGSDLGSNDFGAGPDPMSHPGADPNNPPMSSSPDQPQGFDQMGMSGAPSAQPPQQGFSFQPPQPAAQPAYSQQENTEFINSKNLEVISSKIDALRAALDSINQRLAHLEQIAQGEHDRQKRGGFY